LIVAKNRNGQTGRCKVVWRGEYQEFADEAPSRFNEFDEYAD